MKKQKLNKILEERKEKKTVKETKRKTCATKKKGEQ